MHRFGDRIRPTHVRRTLVVGAVSLFVIACTPTRDARPAPDTTKPTTTAEQHPPGTIVDSILPIEEQLRRFRVGLDSVSTLRGGAESRDALVARFARAIAQNDTAAFRDMLVSRAEFAYLYYPASQYTKPPYRQDPSFVWFRTEMTTKKGLVRIVRRLAGHPFTLVGYRCDSTPEVRGDIRYWQNCLVQWKDSSSTVTEKQLFGSIMEHQGTFKFVSYATDY